jgi:uncharacterized protein (DUF488 family)
MIYSIGYQRLDIAQLDAILDELGADLIDVRAVPFSRRPEFRQAALRQRYQARYIAAGHWLGGQPKGRETHQTTAEGIAWLKQAGERKNVVIMCMEEHPGHCHRHSLICADHFPDALHVFQGQLYLASDLTQANASPVEVTLAPVRRLASWR